MRVLPQVVVQRLFWALLLIFLHAHLVVLHRAAPSQRPPLAGAARVEFRTALLASASAASALHVLVPEVMWARLFACCVMAWAWNLTLRGALNPCFFSVAPRRVPRPAEAEQAVDQRDGLGVQPVDEPDLQHFDLLNVTDECPAARHGPDAVAYEVQF